MFYARKCHLLVGAVWYLSKCLSKAKDFIITKQFQIKRTTYVWHKLYASFVWNKKPAERWNTDWFRPPPQSWTPVTLGLPHLAKQNSGQCMTTFQGTVYMRYHILSHRNLTYKIGNATHKKFLYWIHSFLYEWKEQVDV